MDAGGDVSVLSRLVPVGVVRAVLAEAGVVSRSRRTSAVFGVYLVLACTLFPQVSVSGVFEKLTGVFGGGGRVPSASALNRRRASLGPVVFAGLFDRLRSAGAQVPGARWRGMLVCAVDGTVMEAPDTDSNRALGRMGNQSGPGPFPLVRLLVLVACGSRALIGAAVDGVRCGESVLAERLIPLLEPGMLLLADRGFPGFALWCRCAATDCQLLWRVSRSIRLGVDEVLPDGSALAWWNPPGDMSARKRLAAGLPERARVRVVTGWIGVIGPDGVRRSQPYRIVTTLLDHRRYPADELVRLYGRRWQVELMIKGLKCVQLGGGRPLRSRTLQGVLAESWAALCLHQVLRLQAATAAADTDSDIRQIRFTALVTRLRDTVVRTGGRSRRDITARLRELCLATAQDIDTLDLRIRRYDRVVKTWASKFPSKRPRHGGSWITLEYTIDTAPAPAPAPAPDNDPKTPREPHASTKITA
jgi:hypothetical protein